jgi:serine/threonine protein kinase
MWLQVVAEGRVTKASDIYSLGVVMWELYNCCTPWVRERDGAYNLHPRFNAYPPGTPLAYMRVAQK